MRTLTAITATALAALVLAAPADAQGRARRQMVPRGMRMGVQMPRHDGFRGRVVVPFGPGAQAGRDIRAPAWQGRFRPGMLLRQRGFLELTDDQVASLEGLVERVQQARDGAADAVREHQEALREAFEADQPDVNAIRTHAQAMHEAQQAVQLEHLTATAEAKGLLTDEQRTKIEAWVAGARWGGRGVPRVGRMPMRGWGFRPIR